MDLVELRQRAPKKEYVDEYDHAAENHTKITPKWRAGMGDGGGDK